MSRENVLHFGRQRRRNFVSFARSPDADVAGRRSAARRRCMFSTSSVRPSVVEIIAVDLLLSSASTVTLDRPTGDLCLMTKCGTSTRRSRLYCTV